jgi:hypothetical protein
VVTTGATRRWFQASGAELNGQVRPCVHPAVEHIPTHLVRIAADRARNSVRIWLKPLLSPHDCRSRLKSLNARAIMQAYCSSKRYVCLGWSTHGASTCRRQISGGLGANRRSLIPLAVAPDKSFDSLIPEVLKEMEDGEDLKALQTRMESGQQELSRQEARERERLLQVIGVRNWAHVMKVRNLYLHSVFLCLVRCGSDGPSDPGRPTSSNAH